MIKNRSILETEVNGRSFRLECAGESSFDEVSAALGNMNSFITKRLEEIKSQQIEKPEEAKEN